jgi:adenine-specific DNA-methyltransferase
MAHKNNPRIAEALLALVPSDGRPIGNAALREELSEDLGRDVEEYEYISMRDALIAQGLLVKGKGRGGSVRRGDPDSASFDLQTQQVRDSGETKGSTAAKPRAKGRSARKGDPDPHVISYRHSERRKNNPEVGMVDPDSDPDGDKASYAYDPHLDPALQFDVGRAKVESIIDDALASGNEAAMREALLTLKRIAEPYLDWSGKAERTSFEIDTVSLHVHERIDPATILGAVQKRLKQGNDGTGAQQDWLRAWFETPLPYREAIEFYKHDRGWCNRLIAGDSLLVMNSLLQKEGMAGQVQMIYIDPPYGIKYGSNFQPFVNKRDVKDRKDEDLTQEPEMVKAFRDTWELGIHSYLTYLRDRITLCHDLLAESGSLFVQIGDENPHLVRLLLDELFGAENFCGFISYRTTGGQSSALLSGSVDYLLWYAKDREKAKPKFHRVRQRKPIGNEGSGQYVLAQSRTEATEPRRLSDDELRDLDSAAKHLRVLAHDTLSSQGSPSDPEDAKFAWRGQVHACPANTHWKPGAKTGGMARLARAGRLMSLSNTPRYKRFWDDYPVSEIDNVWNDTAVSGFARKKEYVVETSEKVVERCILMTTDPGDLVIDPTCGSGTTAYVSERWGRRWITCDTSRVAITLAKQRLITASFDYFELKYPHEGLKGGFIYKTVPHVTLKSIANNPDVDEIFGRMHPEVESELARLNQELRKASSSRSAPAKLVKPGIKFTVTEGGKKGEIVDFSAPSSPAVKLPSGEMATRDALLEWEVPFDYPSEWPAEAKPAFEAFHAARQAMQSKMDATIAAHAESEVLYDQPEISKVKRRVSGPFTVEAVPSPMVLSIDETERPMEADVAIARSGQSSRHHQWRDEMTKTGIRGKGGQVLRLSDLETLPDTRYLHCTGTVADSGDRVVVSFGPEHAALEQRQVELAIREAGDLFPRPKMIVFCSFAFDPEAAKDIDATRGIVALKAQMNTDLLTEDLKKARASNQSFWLMGQPDVELRMLKDGKYQVEVHGFDYFDTVKGELVSGGKGKIAAWTLDTDYDERSLFPRQVFFPMAGAKDGWNKLRKDIKAELNEALLGQLHGTTSLPFEAGENRKIAVKIVDDRGIESLKIIKLA